MVAERKVIDIDNSPDLEALADELERHPAGIELRRNGHRVAVVTDAPRADNVSSDEADESIADAHSGKVAIPPMTPEQVEDFKRLAGSLEGLIDRDEMHRNVQESRELSVRQNQERYDRIWRRDEK